jgi:LysR family transcriptional regulator, hca operon transcriptional activator
MELRQLRYFVAVAEALNFRRASNQLHVAQPSLSVQIRQLEDELGVPLLLRTKRRVELTRAGAVFLLAARDILLKTKQASQAALHAVKGEAGTIRLGFNPTASFHILPRLLEKIRKVLPLVNVEFKEGPEAAQIPGIRSGTFDISLGPLGGRYDEIQSMPLLRERILVALPKGHRAARKRAVGFEDLKGELFIIPSKDLLPTPHQIVAAAFLQNHVPLGGHQVVEHFHTGVSLIKARVGVSFMPSSAKDSLPAGIVLRPPTFSIPTLDTFALWSRGNVDPLTHRILGLLKEIKNEL